MSSAPVLVIDTNILVGALMSDGGAPRRVLRHCLTGAYQPVVGAALYTEYEDVFGRDSLFSATGVSPSERATVLNAFLSRCQWVDVYFGWRPNLPDEADNHLVELAVAASAAAIVTRNIRDLARGELRFPHIKILRPELCLERFDVNSDHPPA